VFAQYKKGELKVAARDKLHKNNSQSEGYTPGQKEGCHAEHDA